MWMMVVVVEGGGDAFAQHRLCKTIHQLLRNQRIISITKNEINILIKTCPLSSMF